MRRLLLFACMLFGFMACTQSPIEEQSAIRTDAPETLRVGFEDDETRIQLNEAQKTVWTKDDLVSVFYRSDANQKWQYQGESGERVGDLKRVENATSTTKTTKTVVVYPYSESYWLNTDSYAIDATLPATQYYAEGSYGIGSNLMVSQSEFTQFSLKSVCGWLKLQLTGNGAVVKSIKFRGNDGEQVAGLIYVDTATAEATLASEMGSSEDNNVGGNLVFDDTILTEVTLDCGAGVTLGAEAIPFYISLPPQTFANGFTVEIEDTDGYAMEQSTAKTFVVERNTISPMAAIEFINPNPPTPASNEIWYTATAKAEPYSDDSWAFGSDVVSNVWNSETKRGIITFDGDVTMIGDWAFRNCSSLISITIPDSVTTIGDHAFRYCNSLTSVTIPDSVTTIGSNAFYDCSSLTSVTIGDSVTAIGCGAFENCSSLQEFNGKFASEDGRCLIINCVLNSFAPAGLTEYTIPDSVTTIGDAAFSGCSSLTSVTIGDSVTTIGDGAFGSCSSLTSVNIPDSVTTIGNYTFIDCSSLTSVTLPDSVTTIGDSAFYGCSLTSITIPDSVTTIGDYAFFFCTSLTSVTIGDRVTTIGDYAFYSCDSLTSITIPDSVTTIGDGAFAQCASLTSVNIGDSVTTIGECAFEYCSSLTSVTIPDSVTTIGNSAFSWCSNLTSVTIPDSVTTIGNYTFFNCGSLTSVYCKATTPPVGGSSMFYNNASGRKIYVPMESVEAYKSAGGWSDYASDIVGYNFENGVAVTPKPANNEIWYTNGSTTEATTPDSTTAFCANIVSNTYDAAKECWVIKFDGEVTTIGDDAFYACTSLTSVTIPDSATTIGGGAFAECSSLTSVTIPDSVTTIGDYAFRGCTSLTSVTIGDSVTAIGEGAFESCTSLTSVTIPDSVTTIGEGAFYYCQRLTSVTIPDSVTEIGDWAFPVCSSLQEFNGKFASEDGRCLIIDGVLNSFAPAGLTEYTIPNSVTTIGVGAFYGCRSLTSVTIPDSVTTIGDTAFEDCSSLTSVTIGDSVTAIGDSAFSWCDSLTNVYCKAITPPAGDYSMFYNNASDRKIYVPMESVEAYKSASYWKNYADAIVGYNF